MGTKGVVVMGFEESNLIDTCYRVLRGDITTKEASFLIGKSYRQTLRIIEKVDKHGPIGIKHGNLGRAPVNKTPELQRKKVLDLYLNEYFDHNLTHFLEKLEAKHNIKMNHETMRLWAHKVNHVKRAHKRKKKKQHPRRNRMSQSGMLLQMDGSSHDWFGNGIKPSLIGNIDDATSECCFAEFFPAEDRFAVLTVMRRTIEKHGVPEVVYVDRAGAHGKDGLFRKFDGWQDHITDLERALLELGCRLVFAHSPQAKGRIERMWNTFQDRLIPELRLNDIKRIPSANKFLQEHFIPMHNEKFASTATNPNPAWKAIPEHLKNKLDEIFCIKEYRKIQNGEVISFGGQIYNINHNFETSLSGMRIEIRTYLDGTQKYFYTDKEIQLEREGFLIQAA